MPSDPRLAALPELRQLAERGAREAYDAFCRCVEEQPRDSITGRRRKMAFSWDDDQGIRGWWIDAHLTLLCDLTRPASRYAVCLLVAEKVGILPAQPSPAPGLFRLTDPEPVWWLDVFLGDGDDAVRRAAFHDADRVSNTRFKSFWIPGVAALTDPAEALTAIALHLFEVPRAG